MKNAGVEAFVTAISNGRLTEADALLAARIDINSRVNGRTPLHYVVDSRASLPGFRWLLQNGVRLDELDDNGLTPLMTVCGRPGTKATEMALALIDAGCDVNVRRKSDGMSAIEFAAKGSEPRVIRALVLRGAALNGATGGNLFPALLAVRAGNLKNLKTLIELGCDLGRKTQLPWAKGMTCLGVARLERHTAIVKYLEKIGAP